MTQPNHSIESDTPEKKSLSRRLFLGGFLAVFGSLWAALAAVPLVSYIWPRHKEVVMVDEVSVCAVTELPPGNAKNFKFGSIPALVIHTKKGELFAYNAKCSHLGCTVQYKEDINNIYCACHGGQYDMTTGKNIAGPPPKPLAPLKATIENGLVVVTRA